MILLLQNPWKKCGDGANGLPYRYCKMEMAYATQLIALGKMESYKLGPSSSMHASLPLHAAAPVLLRILRRPRHASSHLIDLILSVRGGAEGYIYMMRLIDEAHLSIASPCRCRLICADMIAPPRS